MHSARNNINPKQNKTLVLLCDSYPLSAGEFFLDDEIRVIHPNFEKIYVLTKEQSPKELNRFIPDNLEIITYNPNINKKHKLKAIPKIFSIFFVSELFRALFKFKIKPSPLLFKIMFMDIVRSNILISELKNLISTKNIDVKNAVFYSYWHDYKAFALARINKENKYFKTIARAHRWDIYFEANKFPYLPYKKFIIENISRTISISNDGVKYFQRLLDKDLSSKIFVSKLGKINNRKPQQEKQDNQIIICSCSTIIPVKRVNLIIDLLASLNISNLKWVHFGDGFLRKEITEYAAERLPNIQYKLKGIVPNNKILDFYSQNYVDLFVNLSESEGIPVSIMEALSAGIPVLATNVGGTAEAINVENGFLLPKDFDINEVSKLVEDYFASSQENQLKYRQNAYYFWKENFEATKNYTTFSNKILNLNCTKQV